MELETEFVGLVLYLLAHETCLAEAGTLRPLLTAVLQYLDQVIYVLQLKVQIEPCNGKVLI